MYAVPEGIKCLISASKGNTIIRNKVGKIITTVNTLLPNGNKNSKDENTTLLQGIFNIESKVLYITDILMWNNDLLIDLNSDARLHIAFSKISEIPLISTDFSDSNEILVRFPNIFYCTKEGLLNTFYGLYSEFNTPDFSLKYQQILDQFKFDGFIKDPNDFQINCSRAGYDNLGGLYKKCGIAFLKKEGFYTFGYTHECLVWKLPEICTKTDFNKLKNKPIQAKLIGNLNGKLQTNDGFEIINYPIFSPQIIQEKFEVKYGQRYLVEFENAKFHSENILALYGMQIKCEINDDKILWDSSRKILFKANFANKNIITYEMINLQIKN